MEEEKEEEEEEEEEEEDQEDEDDDERWSRKRLLWRRLEHITIGFVYYFSPEINHSSSSRKLSLKVSIRSNSKTVPVLTNLFFRVSY